MKRRYIGAFALSMVVQTACANSQPVVEQKRFSFHVEGDPGKPVSGASLILNGQTIATTNTQGLALVAVNGHEGEALEVSVRCPADYQSPARATTIAVRKLAGDKVPQYDATCIPKTRTVVIAVNGMKGYRLPVTELGKTIGETDDLGVATVLLHVEPNEQIELALDTTAPENSLIRPRNPVATFTAKNEDDVFVFDPQLSLAPKPRPLVAHHHIERPSGPPVPIRLQ